MTSPEPNLYFWAKTLDGGQPGISVQEHCLNVGCVAEQLVLRFSHIFADKVFATWLAACHDIGKISPGFQKKCVPWLLKNGLAATALTRAWVAAESDHSKVSQYSLQYILQQRFSTSRAQAAFWAAAAGMHHGRPHWRGEWRPRVPGIAADDGWEAARRRLADRLAQTFGVDSQPPRAVNLENLSALWWTAGLITLADWIGSDEQFFPPTYSGDALSVEDCRKRARAAVDLIGIQKPDLPPGQGFSDLFGFPPNDLQKAALKMIQGPGAYVIEAPMGMGKTEAALAVAYELVSRSRATGLYFALPTQATSNRIHERVSAFLNRVHTSAPRLIHGGSWLVDHQVRFPVVSQNEDRSTAVPMRDWFASSKRALIAPFGVGTLDQALLGVIAAKHFFVRHFALAGKVVVLDEVHSYDVFTGTLIEALVKALVNLRCTVIILSATLTKARRDQLLAGVGLLPADLSATRSEGPDPFPLLTSVTSEGLTESCCIPAGPAKITVSIRFGAEAQFLEEAVQAARAGACVLWICNTVDRATATFRAIKAERQEGDPPVGLLHSRFPFFRRQQLEEDWMQKLGKERRHRPPGCLLVSTQIVEQSVDLDADLLVSELAPTDMLFQRLGRLWRHHSADNGARPRAHAEVWILSERLPFQELAEQEDARALCDALGKKARVYAPYVLLRSLEQWHARHELTIPDDIRSWLEATYVFRTEDARPGWKHLLEQLEAKRAAHQRRAETIQNVWNIDALADEEGVGTRLNECPTIPLILATSIEETTFSLLSGRQVPVDPYRFDYSTARALHQNMVKAPAWWFQQKQMLLKSLPPPVASTVALHVRGSVELGLVQESTVLADSLGSECRLTFDSEIGLSLSHAAPVSPQPDDYDDESYD